MLYIKFQTSEQSGSAEDFKFFFIYFYGLNIGPLVPDHPGTFI